LCCALHHFVVRLCPTVFLVIQSTSQDLWSMHFLALIGFAQYWGPLRPI
jgi:hypothetical protein